MEQGISPEDPRYRQILNAMHEVRPTYDTSQIELYLLFLQVAGEGFADRQVFFDRFALSEGKMAILWQLKALGPLTPTQLAKANGVTPGTITGLLAGLERSGFIIRQEHPTDGRKATIALAPSTPTMLEQVLNERITHMEELLAGFTSQEQQQLRTLLRKLHQRFTTDSAS